MSERKIWLAEESVVLIKAYLRDKNYRSIVKALFDAGFDRDIPSIKARLHVIGLPGNPPMNEEEAIAESNRRTFANALVTRKPPPRRWDKTFRSFSFEERADLTCLCCRQVFGSWDRKKNRLCVECRGGDELGEMSI